MFSDKKLIIGCPLKGRSNIIEHWLQHSILSAGQTDINFAFWFLIDRNDPVADDLIDLFNKYELINHLNVDFFEPFDGKGSTKEHHWHKEKYEYMVELRNTLLGQVRKVKPDFFLSLDSDILLQKQTISNLLETSSKFDAVGGRTYLSYNSKLPSYAMLNKSTSNLHRPDIDQICKVDVIMAIKLMKERAYNVDYAYDSRGEDIGWSLNAKKEKVSLGYDGRVANKHIMEESMLGTIDKRVGY